MKENFETDYTLEVVSDLICPWCFIMKRRLDEAISTHSYEPRLEVRWRPYELNPDMPREGLDRVAYRSAKFGSWDRSLELDAQVTEAGSGDGLTFRHDLMKRTPNTLASHVLVHHAGQVGNQPAVVEALFQAYFSDGRDVGEIDTLLEIGIEQGMDAATIKQALSDEDLRSKVAQQAGSYRAAGLNGVPTLLLNRFVLTTGAVPAKQLAKLLQTGMNDRRVIEVGSRAKSA